MSIILSISLGVALALASTPGGPYTSAAQAQVGIKKSSVRYALQALTSRADVITGDDTPVLTDPLLELWLQRHAPM